MHAIRRIDKRPRLGLRVREAAWVLGLSEPQVRRMLRSGLLVWIVDRRRVDPASVHTSIPRDSTYNLRVLAMEHLLAGRIDAPSPEARYARARPITLLPLLLARNSRK